MKPIVATSNVMPDSGDFIAYSEYSDNKGLQCYWEDGTLLDSDLGLPISEEVIEGFKYFIFEE